MRTKCAQCDVGNLQVMGLSNDKEWIRVTCIDCGKSYEISKDGLNEGGFEFLEAMLKDGSID